MFKQFLKNQTELLLQIDLSQFDQLFCIQSETKIKQTSQLIKEIQYLC